jgi:site-specific DNA recombinase
LQRAAIVEYCRAHHIKLAKLYVDDGVTSKIPWAQRPGGRELWQEVQAGRIKTILIWKIDRAVRKLAELLNAVDALDKLGVKLTSTTQYVPDGPTGGLMLSVLGAFAEFEKSMILERTREGSYTKAADAYRWMGGPANYGYQRVRDEAAKRTHLVISVEATTGHPRLASEQRVVTEIYTRAAAGDTSRQISDRLNRLRIPAGNRKRGAAQRWVPARIRGLLRQEIYMGRHTYGRRSKWKDGPPPVLRSVPELAIVPPELWAAANAALKANESLAKSHTDREYLLTGLIHCSHCSKRYKGTSSHGHTSYRCGGRSAAYNASGLKCTAAQVPGPALEAAVWEDVEGLFRRPDRTLRAIDEQVATAHGPTRIADELADVRAARQVIGEQRMRLEREHLRCPYPDDVLDRLRRELADSDVPLQQQERALERLNAETRLRARAQEQVASVLAEHREKVLSGRLTFEERRNYVRLLVRAIVVRSVEGQRAPEVAIEYRFAAPTDRWESGRPKVDDPTKCCRPTTFNIASTIQRNLPRSSTTLSAGRCRRKV